jgi:hypothetical protein
MQYVLSIYPPDGDPPPPDVQTALSAGWRERRLHRGSRGWCSPRSFPCQGESARRTGVLIMNDIRLRGLVVAGADAAGGKNPTTTPRPLAT